jgi:hypothetical protein
MLSSYARQLDAWPKILGLAVEQVGDGSQSPENLWTAATDNPEVAPT